MSAPLYARYYFAVRDKFMANSSRNTDHKDRIKSFKFDKFKLRQSRAGYNAEVTEQYKQSIINN